MPFIADDQIVAQVARLMTMWNDAVGSDAKMRATASGISSAAGLNDLQQAISNPSLIERPWKMLAAVALRANQTGDPGLAARIFGFTHFWSTQIAPQLRPADWFDMRLDKVPPILETEIASIAIGSLRQLAADQVIFGNATGSMTAGDLKLAAANVLVRAQSQGVPVSDTAMAQARGVLGSSEP